MDISFDKNIYSPNDNITVSGKVYSSDSLNNTNVTIFLNGTTYYSDVDNDGIFSEVINAPSNGDHPMVISYNNISLNKTIRVTDISQFKLSIISSDPESYSFLEFQDDMGSVGITSNASLNGTLKFSNFTYDGVTYFVILMEEIGQSEFDYIFISSTADFSVIEYSYLSEDSKISLGDEDFIIKHINPDGASMLIAKEIEPIFYGSGSESAKLMILALDSEGNLISNISTASIKQVNQFGIDENISAGIQSPSEIAISQNISGITRYGIKIMDIDISTAGGRYDLIIGNTAIISYFVENFDMMISVENLDGSVISSASKGQTIVLKASIVESSNSSAIKTASVNAVIISPNITEKTVTLSNNADNLYVGNTTLSSSLSGKYIISFKASYLNNTISKEYAIQVQSNSLFMKAFSKDKGESNGFAPLKEGILIIGGRDLSTNEFINLSDLTHNCNASYVFIDSMLDEKNIDRISGYQTFNITRILNISGATPWMISEMTSKFGEKACAINFTTPKNTGTYRISVISNISGDVIAVKNYIDVTSLYAYGMPVNCNTGGWVGSISPGSEVCIKVNAYDSARGKQISPSNITEINLIEVFSISKGTMITKSIKNISVKSIKGEKVLSFISSNNSLGMHDLKLRVKANTSSGLGTGLGRAWYMTELWNAWAHPECSDKRFCNFGPNSNISINVESFSAGYGSGQEGLTASVNQIRNFQTNEVISVENSDGVSCVTEGDNSSESQGSNNSITGGAVTPASCSITISKPATGWESGNHEVSLIVKDEDDNQMTIYSWFNIQTFAFWAWNKNWEMTKNQNAEFEITIKDFSGTPLDADVSIKKMYYNGDEGSWMSPKEINVSSNNQQINGNGTYTIDKSVFSNLKSGFYEVILLAVTDGGQKQTVRVGFRITSFVVVANNLGENWDHSYEIGKNVTINISAFDSINWSTWPPTGTSHNITNATVKVINKQGMWDVPYKQSGKDSINDTNDCTGTTNSCVLTVPIDGFDQSNYDMRIEVSDAQGNTGMANYWFKTETYRITIPEVQDWRTIPVTNKLSDKIQLNIRKDISCGTNTDSIIEPSNVTNCLVQEVRLPTIYDNQDNRNKITVILLDKTDKTSLRVYVNKENSTNINSTFVHNDFRSATRLSIGKNFTDSNGYLWQITGIDASTDTIRLKSLDGYVLSRTNQGGQTGGETEVEYLSIYIVNKSLSKSGVFLYSGNSGNEERFWDEKWANIDLDNDGKYNCYNDGNNTWACEEYFMLLSDFEEAGKYDTIILSKTRNMTQGVNSYFGWNNTKDIRLNDSALPIYLLNVIYSESNGVGRYRIVTTTNQIGWPGRHLGLFQVGSSKVRIPVMVSSPSTKQGIADQQVVIRKLKTFGSFNFKEYDLQTIASGITSSNGIAILDVNLSSIPSGEYSIIVEVNGTTEYITSGNDWDNPKIELRSFALSNLLGQKKTLNLIEWSENNNNLFRLNSTETRVDPDLGGKTVISMNCGDWNNDFHSMDLCHADDWRYRQLWVNLSNASNPTILYDNTPDDWRLKIDDINSSNNKNISDPVYVQNEFGVSQRYVFINASILIEQIHLFVGQNRIISQPGRECQFRIELLSANQSDSSIRLNAREICPWGSERDIENDMIHRLSDREFLWGFFNISDVTDNDTTLNLFKRTLELESPIPPSVISNLEQGNDGRMRVVNDAFYKGYDLYIYNSNQSKTRDDLQGMSGMFDRIVLVNSSNESIFFEYAFGEPIDELDGKAVVSANPWNQYVFMSNLTLNGNIIYPLPWGCDGEKYYATNFSEQQIGFKMDDCYEAQLQPLSSENYYMVMFDSMCDDNFAITNAKFDDDPILDDSWVNGTSYDYTRPEGGSEDICNFNQEGGNRSERWMDIGRENWPISITGYDLDAGTIDLFKVKRDIQPYENLTELSLWVQAKNFDGTPINGTISLDKAVGMSWSCGIMQEETINVSPTGGNFTDGTGYLDLDISQITTPKPTLKFSVVDALLSTKKEMITKTFWYGPAENMQMDKKCENIFFPDAIGGGAGGGPSPEEIAEFNACNSNNELLSCETAYCAWTNTSIYPDVDKIEFLTQDINPMMCIPCPMYDYNQAGCEAFNNTCVWSAGENLCDSIGMI